MNDPDLALHCPLCDYPMPAFKIGVCARHSRLLHLDTLVVGNVKKVYAPGEYVNAEHGRAVTAPVVELSTGDAFVVRPGDVPAFVAISERNFVLYELLLAALATTLVKALHIVGSPPNGDDAATSHLLVRAALTATLRRLDAKG